MKDIPRLKEVPGKQRLAPWRVVLAAAWTVVIVALGVASRLESTLRICTTSTVATEPNSSEEISTNDNGAVTGKKTTSTGQTEQTTKTCEPVSVGELAVISLPLLILISPILKGFNIAGLFGIDFREFQEKVVQEAKEQSIRVIIEYETGARTKTALDQAQQGRVSDLPQE